MALMGKAFAQMQLVAAELDPTLDPFSVAESFLLRNTLRQVRESIDPKKLFYDLQKARLRVTRVLEAVTLLGSQAVVISVASCAALILFFQGRRDRALLIAIAIAGAELLLWILKVEFHRPRPEPFFGSVPPASYSFPSGHALLSFCCYGTLSAVCSARRWVRIAAAALILSIGISRVYLGVHYPSDVIAGYLVAILWMASVAVAYRRLATMDR